MKNVIYQIQNIRTKTLYIGSTVDFKARKRVHLSLLRKNNHYSKYMQRAFNKYGESVFLFSVLEENIIKDNLIKKEQYYMDLMNPKYNMVKTAGRVTGRKESKISIAKRAKHLKGMKFHTEESKAAIARALKGNKYSAGRTDNRKINKKIYLQIMKLRSEGFGCRKIATKTGLSKTTILNVFNNKFNYGYTQ